ncbi:hypothetical protein F5B20DRAFT_525565 [Whalleya microplaca]|nr:hypothetical protein F5B20DRAFT_525565 [Whalleya microplaca]
MLPSVGSSSTTATDPASASSITSPSQHAENESAGGVSRLASPHPHKRGPSYDAQSPDSNVSSQPLGDGASPAANEDPGDRKAKKRRTGPGSRGVANLTAEQLAKKRANDREAQRAIRERTKHQIENLEKRIRELTSQQPYQELQAVIRAKEAVEAENAEIKRRLASIMSLIQPVLSNQQGDNAYVSSTPTYTEAQPVQPTSAAPSAHNVSTPGSVMSPVSTTDSPWPNSQGQAQPSPRFDQVQMLNQQRHDLFHNLDLRAGEQLKLDFLLDPSQRVKKMQTGPNGPQDTPSYQHLPMKHDWHGASYPLRRSSSNISGGSQRHHNHGQRIEYTPEYTTHLEASWAGDSAPIKNCAPTCVLDKLLTDFLHERRQRAAEGVPTQEIVGPKYPSVSSLLNPANSAFSHPISKVFTDVLATFPGLCTLPERVAILYIMFLNMRWQISPLQENYDLLPQWIRPVPAQFHTSHPVWVDYLPFPRMREKLAKEYNPTEYLFDNIFIPYTTTISINWPYEGTDTLLQSPDGSELLINPVFERHLRRLENWTLGDAFDKMFPGLRGTYNLKRDYKASNEQHR